MVCDDEGAQRREGVSAEGEGSAFQQKYLPAWGDAPFGSSNGNRGVIYYSRRKRPLANQTVRDAREPLVIGRTGLHEGEEGEVAQTRQGQQLCLGEAGAPADDDAREEVEGRRRQGVEVGL